MPAFSFSFMYYTIKCILNLLQLFSIRYNLPPDFFLFFPYFKSLYYFFIPSFFKIKVTCIILLYLFKMSVSMFSIYPTSWSKVSQSYAALFKIGRFWFWVTHLFQTLLSWFLFFVIPQIFHLLVLPIFG